MRAFKCASRFIRDLELSPFQWGRGGRPDLRIARCGTSLAPHKTSLQHGAGGVHFGVRRVPSASACVASCGCHVALAGDQPEPHTTHQTSHQTRQPGRALLYRRYLSISFYHVIGPQHPFRLRAGAPSRRLGPRVARPRPQAGWPRASSLAPSPGQMNTEPPPVPTRTTLAGEIYSSSVRSMLWTASIFVKSMTMGALCGCSSSSSSSSLPEASLYDPEYRLRLAPASRT